MGQKAHPYGYRLGITKPWKSRWFTTKNYAAFLVEDSYIREMVKKKLYQAGISRVEIERKANQVSVTIYTAKPGMVVGKQGKGIEDLREQLNKKLNKKIEMNVQEIRNIDLEAQLIAENVALQLEKRVAFRRAMKQAMQRTMKSGGKGIKIMCAGRLGGVEIARTEWLKDGRIPLQTLRSDIDYGVTEANTVFGKIGVKVWVCRGELFPNKAMSTTRQTEKGKKPMLMPKRTKFRKQHRGRMTGTEVRGNKVDFGDFGLQALEPAWITSRQIEAARRAMTRYTRRGGKIFIRVFPDKPVTAKPAETRMGSGKGSPEYWVAVVKPGRILFEIKGITEESAKEAMRLSGAKLPIRTKFITKEMAQQEYDAKISAKEPAAQE